jgi:Glutaredoxin-like domain (DUF836)
MSAPAPRKLTLISRRYCHLCDDMQSALENLQDGLAFGFEVIDLDVHPAMEGRYGELVPVLLDGDAEICHYFLDQEKLAAHLASV